jgi:L-ascorbate metabolism protein UlaG (beta-lactamase superfamily)
MRLTLVGHATVLIELDGVRLLTDPLRRDRTGFLLAGSPTDYQAAARGLDAALISHFHRDHYDPRSLRSLDPLIRLIGPPGTATRVRRQGLSNVSEIQPGESIAVEGVTVRATKALHGRLPRQMRSIALGFLVCGTEKVYFAGDTDLFPEMDELASENVDVALLPVGGWGPRLGSGHLDPRRAAEALRLIRPRIAVPIHWGFLAPAGLGRRELCYLTEPGKTFAELAAATAPEVAVNLLEPGESLDVTASLRD